jgi:uncharacterized protein YndB with AHSA1/START domain
MDVRPGGAWRYTMHGPDETDYPNHGAFVEVVRPERTSYTNSGSKKRDPCAQFQATRTFEQQRAKTKLTLHLVFPSAEVRDHVAKVQGAVEGGIKRLNGLRNTCRRGLQRGARSSWCEISKCRASVHS